MMIKGTAAYMRLSHRSRRIPLGKWYFEYTVTVLDIDSPGGSVAGTEAFADLIKDHSRYDTRTVRTGDPDPEEIELYKNEKGLWKRNEDDLSEWINGNLGVPWR